jgi:hypothetical protein
MGRIWIRFIDKNVFYWVYRLGPASCNTCTCMYHFYKMIKKKIMENICSDFILMKSMKKIFNFHENKIADL